MRPNRDDLEGQLELARQATDHGLSGFPDLSYEEGVRDALEWAVGETATKPMEEG